MSIEENTVIGYLCFREELGMEKIIVLEVIILGAVLIYHEKITESVQ